MIVVLLLFAALYLPANAADDSTTILPSAQVQLRNPQAISYSPTGLIYIADTGNQRVIAVDSSGALLYEVGGIGRGNGQFNRPRDVAAEYGTEVWVLDYGNRRLQKFTRSLEWVGTLDFAQLEGAGDIRPAEMAESASGDLYLFDADRGQIIQLTSAGIIIASSAGNADFFRGGSNFVCGAGGDLFWIDSETRHVRRTDAALTLRAQPEDSTALRAQSISTFGGETIIASEGDILGFAPLDRFTATGIRLHSTRLSISNGDRLVMVDRFHALWLGSREGRLERIRLQRP